MNNKDEKSIEEFVYGKIDLDKIPNAFFINMLRSMQKLKIEQATKNNK